MKKKQSKPKTLTIEQYIQNLSEFNKKLLEEYIKHDYVSKVRTGKGKKANFIKQHQGPEGIKIVQEILKFKRLENSRLKD